MSKNRFLLGVTNDNEVVQDKHRKCGIDSVSGKGKIYFFRNKLWTNGGKAGFYFRKIC